MESLFELQLKIEKLKRLIAMENMRHEEDIKKLTESLAEKEKAVEDWGKGNASFRII